MRPHALVPVDGAVLADLRDRVERFRPVPRADPERDLGVPPAVLDALLRRWRGGYDWRVHEARIAALPWRETERAPVPLRAVVAPAASGDPEAPVVVLLHGWPDSVLRFERLLPLLPDATVVVPALPGYPFAAPVAPGGLSATAMADAVADALRELGASGCVVSAGDVGSRVAADLATRHPELVSALHLTDVPPDPGAPPEDLDEEERAFVDRTQRWREEEGGYQHQQATRPDTLAVALGDSPVGLAAWVVEKLLRWSDGDGSLEDVFPLDDALTWVTAYWVSASIGTSFAPYAAPRANAPTRVGVPTVVTLFPGDLVNGPRRSAERWFDVVAWREFERGGHFSAWERPQDHLWGVRAAIAARRR